MYLKANLGRVLWKQFGDEMRKSELLKALQDEIGGHSLGTFWDEGVTKTGCPTCMKNFGTNAQFARHLQFDVLPALLDRLSTEGR